MSIVTDLYERDIERLTDERDEAVRLFNALDRYVGHVNCGVVHGAPECSCGFDDLYTKVREFVRGASPSSQAPNQEDR